jgi:transcriptional activator SPT8
VIGLPDGRHVATASQDNVRLWNTYDFLQSEDNMAKRRNTGLPPFKIIAGHHGGTMSSMSECGVEAPDQVLMAVVDPTCRFLITASGDRGWQGESSKVVLIHEIKY